MNIYSRKSPARRLHSKAVKEQVFLPSFFFSFSFIFVGRFNCFAKFVRVTPLSFVDTAYISLLVRTTLLICYCWKYIHFPESSFMGSYDHSSVSVIYYLYYLSNRKTNKCFSFMYWDTKGKTLKQSSQREFYKAVHNFFSTKAGWTTIFLKRFSIFFTI